MSDNEFINGLIVKAPNDNAPEYVKAKVSIKREELIAWLQTKGGEWINADIKVSQTGKWYVSVDNWKPSGNGTPRKPVPAPARRDFSSDQCGMSDEIPFITNRSRY